MIRSTHSGPSFIAVSLRGDLAFNTNPKSTMASKTQRVCQIYSVNTRSPYFYQKCVCLIVEINFSSARLLSEMANPNPFWGGDEEIGALSGKRDTVMDTPVDVDSQIDSQDGNMQLPLVNSI
jgi:hypothetical protein